MFLNDIFFPIYYNLHVNTSSLRIFMLPEHSKQKNNAYPYRIGVYNTHLHFLRGHYPDQVSGQVLNSPFSAHNMSSLAIYCVTQILCNKFSLTLFCNYVNHQITVKKSRLVSSAVISTCRPCSCIQERNRSAKTCTTGISVPKCPASIR